MSGLQYNGALSIFFAAYVSRAAKEKTAADHAQTSYATFELFANIPLKLFRPSIWLPFCSTSDDLLIGLTLD